ncbi:S41 family peptidase [Polyangium aurulentum]|uniref:S41 family peptidase n=1 Tax=Polyangium aurulentum TaxID=2567896 RepID=UPI0010ADC38F|nr:S41 family peptidase [Polyangium aurulentum]UQA58972.1 S41 family peptidase [Polyangium aurulentum]
MTPLRFLAPSWIASIAFAASACSGAPSPASKPAAPSSVAEGTTAAKSAEGSWRSRGYGLLLTVSGGGLRLHHETAAGCCVDPMESAELLETFGYGRTGPNATSRFFGPPGETQILFDRIDRLPASCEQKRAWDAPEVLDVFAATFSEHYAFFAERGVDWPARVQAGRAKVTPGMPDGAFFDVLTKMLEGLGDAHVGLSAEIDGEMRMFEDPHSRTLGLLAARARAEGRPVKEVERAWLRAYRDGILQGILDGKGRQTANDRIFWGFAARQVGYLNVVTMGGFDEGSPEKERAALESALDEALPAFLERASTVIVDVTNNRGGYDFVARAIASRFAAKKTLVYAKQAYRAEGVEPQAFYVEPSPKVRFTGRVFLLTSDITVSAGEVFTLSMRALPNVVHYGTPTRGALSDMLVKPLPNGWTVSLSNETYRDAKGQAFEGRGIPPTEPFDFFPEGDLMNGHASSVRKLLAHLGLGGMVPLKGP